MARLLKPTAWRSSRFPYVLDLIEHCEFDTIYHEHLCYFSVTAVDNLLRRHGLSLNKVVGADHSRRIAAPLHREDRDRGERSDPWPNGRKALGVDGLPYYESSAPRREAQDRPVAVLRKLKGEGKHIAAYGAAAKGSTMINFAASAPKYLDFVVDRNVHKQGRYMPGNDSRIGPPSEAPRGQAGLRADPGLELRR